MHRNLWSTLTVYRSRLDFPEGGAALLNPTNVATLPDWFTLIRSTGKQTQTLPRASLMNPSTQDVPELAFHLGSRSGVALPPANTTATTQEAEP